jgi:hypothetical protein
MPASSVKPVQYPNLNAAYSYSMKFSIRQAVGPIWTSVNLSYISLTCKSNSLYGYACRGGETYLEGRLCIRRHKVEGGVLLDFDRVAYVLGFNRLRPLDSATLMVSILCSDDKREENKAKLCWAAGSRQLPWSLPESYCQVLLRG